MYARRVASALVGVGLFALTSLAQQAPVPQAPPPDPSKPATILVQKTAPASAQIQAAMANDADVKLAQAKLQVAEAELLKARQAVALKVMTLEATIKDLERQISIQAEKIDLGTKASQRGTGSLAELLETRLAFERVKSALDLARMELRMLTGGEQKERVLSLESGNFVIVLDDQIRDGLVANLKWQVQAKKSDSIVGPIRDRLRAALDKPVKLGPKGEVVTFEKAMEIFKKEAGLDVPVRSMVKVAPIMSEGETFPVGAWLQLFSDNGYAVQNSQNGYLPPIFLVRDYGLLVTSKELAPPNSQTIADLWKEPLKGAKSSEPAIKGDIAPQKR